MDPSTFREHIHALIHEVKEIVLNNWVTGRAHGDMVGAAPYRVSGAIFHHLEQLSIHVMEYNPLIGGSYIKSPNKLTRSKAIRNTQNTDEKWKILV